MPQADLDVLELLERGILQFEEALQQEPDSDYREGQLVYLSEAQDAIRSAGPTERANTVLESAAQNLGLPSDGPSISDADLSTKEVGMVSMWSLCLGFAEGTMSGARNTIAALDQQSGVSGSFQSR